MPAQDTFLFVLCDVLMWLLPAYYQLKRKANDFLESRLSDTRGKFDSYTLVSK